MPHSRKLLCWFYGLIALLALVGTWSHNVAYFRPEEGILAGFTLATARFWPATLATPASTSITIDIGLFLLAASGLMIVESRRLAIRFVWIYIVLGLAVAISVTFPLFLIAREQRLSARGEATADLGITPVDVLGLTALAVSMGAFTLWTLVK